MILADEGGARVSEVGGPEIEDPEDCLEGVLGGPMDVLTGASGCDMFVICQASTARRLDASGDEAKSTWQSETLQDVL